MLLKKIIFYFFLFADLYEKALKIERRAVFTSDLATEAEDAERGTLDLRMEGECLKHHTRQTSLINSSQPHPSQKQRRVDDV